jgi:hypothetical protein
MKQGPLFQRQFFIQAPEAAMATTDHAGAVAYLRLHGHPANPGRVLADQRIFLSAGGTLDVVSASHGGEGLGRIAYTPGLRAAIKRGDQMTYRFEVPGAAVSGATYQVMVHGNDSTPSFRFTIEVGQTA